MRKRVKCRATSKRAQAFNSSSSNGFLTTETSSLVASLASGKEPLAWDDPVVAVPRFIEWVQGAEQVSKLE